MMTKVVKISDELYDQLSQLAEKSNRQIKDLLEEAIKLYLLGSQHVEKDVKQVQGRVIPLHYPSKCRSCGRELREGEPAYWCKFTYSDGTVKSQVLCLDCYYKDTSLAEKYLKERKLRLTIKGLQKMADELADEVERLRLERSLLELKREVRSWWEELKRAPFDPDELRKLEELRLKAEELMDKASSLEDQLKLLPQRRRVKAIAAERS